MAFFGLLVYLFFFFVRLQDWWGPLLGAPIDFIVMSVIVVSLLPSFPRFLHVLKLPQTRFFLFFIVIVAVSNLVNGHNDSAVEYGVKYLKFFIIFLVISISVDSFAKLKWLSIYIIMLIGFIAYQGIIQAETGTNWAGIELYWAEWKRIRWVGLFDGANTLALIFVATVPFLLEYIFGKWPVGYKLFSVVMAYLIFTSFYLANSRGGFLSLLLVLFAFTYTKIEKKKGLIIAGVLAFILLNIAAPARMSEIDDSKHSSRGRIHFWEESLAMVRYHNPLFGVGKGHFTDYTSKVAHNAFLQQLGETGLSGAFCWLAFVYATFLSMVKVFRKKVIDPTNRVIYRSYFITFLSIIGSTLFISADFEFIYILAAFLTAISVLEKEELKFARKDYIIVGALEAAGVFGFYIVVNLFKMIYF